MLRKRRYTDNLETYIFLCKTLAVHPEDFPKELNKTLAENYPINFLPRSKEYAYGALLIKSFELDLDTREDLSFLLLDAGADVNKLDPLKNNALMSAIRNECSIPLIEAIFRKTDNINHTNTLGHTALGNLCYKYLQLSTLTEDDVVNRYQKALLRILRQFLDSGVKPSLDMRWTSYNNALRVDRVAKAISELTTFLQVFSEQKSSMTNSTEPVYDYEL